MQSAQASLKWRRLAVGTDASDATFLLCKSGSSVRRSTTISWFYATDGFVLLVQHFAQTEAVQHFGRARSEDAPPSVTVVGPVVCLYIYLKCAIS